MRTRVLVLGGACAFVFTLLLLFRLDIIDRGSQTLLQGPDTSIQKMSTEDSWKAVFQDREKIGYSHEKIEEQPGGYKIFNKTVMTLTTMGLAQTLSIISESRTSEDFSLKDFTFTISSGRFDFTVKGEINSTTLNITTSETKGSCEHPLKVKLNSPLYLPSALNSVLANQTAHHTEPVSVMVFDPSTMTRVPVTIKRIGEETIDVMGRQTKTTKLALSFKGMIQYAWITSQGEVVKEKGILGITLVKSDRQSAIKGIKAGMDLTQTAGIKSSVSIPFPETLTSLQVKISGIETQNLDLNGGRQTFENNVLTILKEQPGQGDIKKTALNLERFLTPGPFIQSDHPDIQGLADQLVKQEAPAMEKIQRIMAWMEKNIEKKPVLSLPSALSTLKNRSGDCNEHAVLFAALARALNIPAGIETGLVYLNGTFFYHAWNRVYINGWITVDALFNQIPADVTHIRLAASDGAMDLDLLAVFGRLEMKVLARNQGSGRK
ncbi:MAG: transglutaminase-like domain-containing protein [Thermodesulfobacteriota bacterium]|nr:transglutaminase-like domain-containing protein [Thermodesulfobacteriota bacterium]